MKIVTQLVLSSLFFVFSSSLCLALDGVGVLVLDSPVDYRHQIIAPTADLTAMSRYSFTDLRGNYGNWKDLTDQYAGQLKGEVDSVILSKILDYFDNLGNKAKKLEDFAKDRKAIDDYFLAHPEQRTVLGTIGLYLHGTHVAGLSVGGMETGTARLLSAPVFSSHGFELYAALDFRFVTDFLDQLLDKNSSRGQANLDAITLAISEQEIKVVNMSFGRRWTGSIEETLKDRVPLFLSNPDTVFVISAGNSSTNIGGMKGKNGEIFPESGVRNVLLVAALDDKGELASFSDYGDGAVNIAAQGTSIASARPGGGVMHMAGTSMSAPIVTNRVALVRHEHPELNAVEAIRYLLDHETLRNENLVGKVTDGRYLPLRTDLYFRETINYVGEMEKFLNEFYENP